MKTQMNEPATGSKSSPAGRAREAVLMKSQCRRAESACWVAIAVTPPYMESTCASCSKSKRSPANPPATSSTMGASFSYLTARAARARAPAAPSRKRCAAAGAPLGAPLPPHQSSGRAAPGAAGPAGRRRAGPHTRSRAGPGGAASLRAPAGAARPPRPACGRCPRGPPGAGQAGLRAPQARPSGDRHLRRSAAGARGGVCGETRGARQNGCVLRQGCTAQPNVMPVRGRRLGHASQARPAHP